MYVDEIGRFAEFLPLMSGSTSPCVSFFQLAAYNLQLGNNLHRSSFIVLFVAWSWENNYYLVPRLKWSRSQMKVSLPKATQEISQELDVSIEPKLPVSNDIRHDTLTIATRNVRHILPKVLWSIEYRYIWYLGQMHVGQLEWTCACFNIVLLYSVFNQYTFYSYIEPTLTGSSSLLKYTIAADYSLIH